MAIPATGRVRQLGLLLAALLVSTAVFLLAFTAHFDAGANGTVVAVSGADSLERSARATAGLSSRSTSRHETTPRVPERNAAQYSRGAVASLRSVRPSTVASDALLRGHDICTLLPADLTRVSEGRDVAAEVHAALHEWGDHRTFVFTHDGVMLAEANRTWSALLAVADDNPTLRCDGRRWSEAAIARLRRDGVPRVVVSPAVLVVPPFAWSAVCGATPAGVEVTCPLPVQRWRLRDPQDAVVVLDPNSSESIAIREMHLRHHRATNGTTTAQSDDNVNGYFTKPILMWDAVTRMVDFNGRADGTPGCVEAWDKWTAGYRSCSWFVKADTDTYLNRPALVSELNQSDNRGVPLDFEGGWRGVNPVADAAFGGSRFNVRGLGAGESFYFGGTGYFFSRAALRRIAGSPLAAFRLCPAMVREARRKEGIEKVMHLEDVVIGGCMHILDRLFGLNMSFLDVGARVVANVSQVWASHVQRPSKCLCCARALHRVDPSDAARLTRIMWQQCWRAPAPTGSGVVVLRDDMRDFCERGQHVSVKCKHL